jgi:hypothetical protein
VTAQKTEVVYVDGEIKKSERVKGSFTNERGERVPYDYDEARILTDGYDVNVVRFPRDPETGSFIVAEPTPGTRARFECEARNANGNVQLRVKRVVGPTYDDLAAAVREYEAISA